MWSVPVCLCVCVILYLLFLPSLPGKPPDSAHLRLPGKHGRFGRNYQANANARRVHLGAAKVPPEHALHRDQGHREVYRQHLRGPTSAAEGWWGARCRRNTAHVLRAERAPAANEPEHIGTVGGPGSATVLAAVTHQSATVRRMANANVGGCGGGCGGGGCSGRLPAVERFCLQPHAGSVPELPRAWTGQVADGPTSSAAAAFAPARARAGSTGR